MLGLPYVVHLHYMFLDFAGGSKTYTNTGLDANTSISHACNSICDCVEELYLPVCGVNDVTYFHRVTRDALFNAASL